MSLVGTSDPVTSPLPEKSKVPVSSSVGVGETCDSSAGASSRKNGKVNACSVTW
jgi:hypothetical protein